MTTETPIRWKELGAEDRAALIADVVMGWKKTRREIDGVITGYGDDHEGEFRRLPDYSTDLTAAFQVVEKMREKGFTVTMNARCSGTWVCAFWKDGAQSIGDSKELPTAISIGALRAIGMAIERE